MKLDKKYFLAVFTVFWIQAIFTTNLAIAAMDSKDWADIIELGTTILGRDTNTGADSSLERDVNSDEGDIDVNGNYRNRFPCLDNVNTACYAWGKAWDNNTEPWYCKDETSKKKLVVINVNSILKEARGSPNERMKIANNHVKSRNRALSQAKNHPNMDKFGVYQVADKKMGLCMDKLAASLIKQGQIEYWDPGNVGTSVSESNQSSSSSSSQSNSRANQQSANNQSSSSSLSEQSKKKINEAVDQGNNAHDNKDYAKSIDAIKIILANSSNITLKGEATNRLAEYYKYGHGVSKDEVNAQALFEQASIADNPDANAHIGQNYEDGTGGVIKNHQTAIKYFSAAAAKGHVVAMSKLGYLYHAGIGTINPELGNEWTCKAAKQGNSTAIGNAEKLKLNCN